MGFCACFSQESRAEVTLCDLRLHRKHKNVKHLYLVLYNFPEVSILWKAQTGPAGGTTGRGSRGHGEMHNLLLAPPTLLPTRAPTPSTI